MSKDAKASMARRASAQRANDKQAEIHTEIETHPIELPIRGEIQGVESAPEYEFLQVNKGEYKPADQAARKLIRSHVMRNYFQEKRTQTNGVSSANSASTVNAKDKLKGRWRLGKQPLAGDEDKPSQQRKNKLSEGPSHRKSITPPSVEQPLRPPPPLDYLTYNDGRTPDSLILRASPLEQFRANIIDPFDSLPVATSGHRTNRLVHFYQTQFIINSLAQNPSRQFYKYVMTDAGLFHGMLAIVALYMHGHCGIPVKEEILYHRGETMQVIHRGLSNPKAANLMMLLSTIVTITSFENLCGNYFTSRAHLNALRWLIDSTGGIKRYAQVDSVPRAVAWAEYHYAAATRSVPPFKYSPTKPEPSIPEDLLFVAAKDFPYGLATIDNYGHSIFNTLRRLNILGIATSTPWQTLRDSSSDFRYAVSNILLETEYDLLVLAHQLKVDAERLREEGRAVIEVCEALCTASQIFLFAALRNMPLGARVVDIYISRLRPSLQQSDLIFRWTAHASLESLVWVLAVTATAATGRAEHLLAMNDLRKACGILGISDVEGITRILKGYAWNDAFEVLSRDVLRDLFRRRTDPAAVMRATPEGFAVTDNLRLEIGGFYDRIDC